MRFYNRSGRLKAVGQFVADESVGDMEWWGENGQPRQAVAFKTITK